MSRQPRLERSELPLSGAALLELMRAVLARGAAFRFRARGTSMHPFIRDGDIVTVKPLPGSAVETGDVVAFVQPGEGQLRVHRITASHDGRLMLKGDNAQKPDGVVESGGVLGKVVSVERHGRLVLLGTGPERGFIAWLSRTGWLKRALMPARLLYRGLLRK